MHEHLIEKAFKELYPDKEFNYRTVLKYSGKFSGFNGNIRFGFGRLDVRMSKQMKYLSEEIRIGLIQTLLVKIFKPKTMRKVMTTNMDLYEKFLKNVHISISKKVESPLLLEKFNKINEQFFSGLLDQPSLKWGTYSKGRLGSYEYGSDTIVISKHLENAPEEYLEYVLYHEMLHKKHKFTHKNGRSLYHSTVFKADEAKFSRADEMEKEIPRWMRWRRNPKRQSFFARFF
ncbi:hypothetical protein COV16_06460 [Candidatus Woesearchaeota archaeon CG10_big_fil_rev_8_21_14_0_10_34_8]|nr:MAG: hypothetical protein COV16_06460 [Candidatus Woesearchaeota archaeon CG10_big_fil_rev_8_21_14_0_10_34_8]